MSTTQLKHAASYARVAQADSSRIEEQHRRNAMQAHRDGFAVPEGPDYRYDDDGASGLDDHRPGWRRLVEVITSGEAPFQRLYVTDRARLGRCPPQRARYYADLFRTHGVDVVCSSEMSTHTTLLDHE